MNVRAAAAQVLFQVVDKGQSLSMALPAAQQNIRPRDHALLQEICYGALRYLPRLESIANALMDNPLKGKQRVFHHLILVGIYQLSFMRIPAHAAVGETVEGAQDLKGPRLRGLINAVLRNYQRNQEQLDAQAVSHNAGKYSHPSWLLKLLQSAYPQQWEAIVEANNSKAPMWLRVNHQHHDRDAYQALLNNENIDSSVHSQAEDALKLAAPCDVTKLPGFEKGWVSVQDAAAQLSLHYLQPQDGELILDCCAAPGGKTAHILERTQGSEVVAIDCDDTRLKRVHDNLKRLNLSAKVVCGDARYPQEWWQGSQFDRILLDAPCSATGVIRRHPDIKWLRRAEDIAALAELQREILDAMWQQLKPGGTLVYATCSITPQENVLQVKDFLARTSDAQLVGSELDNPGRQILPGEEDMDGFYYAVLTKQA
ncbi:16S rRNA (cytosine(967)-C(5))-methyltransferase RsmB [Vibrio fluvialis]|jgi:16S rRNA (cytosine967-C5)-methyltransferase|uniref:16S rRNA (cytosine(967)-C(5))-methyltransferase RsmB n=1 Tax=Vibrio fluvialis TaxID=676 RepID=UPI00192C6E8E|nr:16S rRNA (cytosine(967)-C(5))-methyltransferase RsmB [Vibrio fluvialis]EKO3374730.1 16S rRNA (cytosine(967)-C(5))-methyltransferase RsmB [Vibrio fluvialis]EKO4007261.1 16S rRNA (cytosine(967)-C(5))-methyltransferase RsmB [Vibrio fluvialis]ELE5028901.1 16S rRNA (cytosine(967)-C(5))-methyltransferase RsmB [Vibrio fluvialis]ELH7952488.1 16S rRNA (cytosine(967)-C(5))-methyltransferase RsmB [Vibrio fluvialis]ELZ1261007.1 16S rRNA (cytosine(967)-C(5))-methyltransferase RsmB [Vibrio fluvialis]